KTEPIARVDLARHHVAQLWPEEEDQQRDQQTPRHHAAGVVERRQFGTNDVSDAKERGADRRPGTRGNAAGAKDSCRSRWAKTQCASAERSHVEEEVMIRREDAELSAQEYNGTDADVVEEVLRRFGAGLTRFVDFGRGYRFGIRQLRIFHHHTANQRDE